MPKAGHVCPPESEFEPRLILVLNQAQLATILHSTPKLLPADQCDHDRDGVAGKNLAGAAHAQRFTVRHRLLKPYEYEQVFNATGQRRVPGAAPVPALPPGSGYQSSQGGVMLRARRNGSDVPRLGLIISKKSIKRAVDRNRVKRITRESFRLSQGRLSGLDVVVMSRAGLGELSGPALRAVLDKHWDGLVRWMERWKKA